MIQVKGQLAIPDAELEWTAIRAQGAGGQNVNKVATALHLRFDSAASTVLPPAVKQRLLALRDRRVGKDGVVIIKSQRYRSQEQNRRDAERRLGDLLRKALEVPKARKPTRPGRGAREKRLADKSHRAKIKKERGRPEE